VRVAAYAALANSHSAEGIDLLIKASGPGNEPDLRYAALSAIGRVDAAEPRTREALRLGLKDTDYRTVMASAEAIRSRKDKELLPALRELKANPPAATQSLSWFPGFVDGVIKDVAGTSPGAK